MALNRAFRLRKNSEFQRVRQQGRSIASRLLILAWAPNDQIAAVHVGFVVSKRVSKRAVMRNHIKRLLAEAIRPYLTDMPAGWDLVISARNQIVGVDFAVIVQDLAQLLRRARLPVSAPVEETSH